jgi:hypothetical protein
MPYIPRPKKIKTGSSSIDALISFLGGDDDPAQSLMDMMNPAVGMARRAPSTLKRLIDTLSKQAKGRGLKSVDLPTGYLSDYTDSVFREMSAERSLGAIPTVPSHQQIGHLSELFASNAPDLALGQGRNKGVIVEFATEGLRGAKSTAKPVQLDNAAEFLMRYNSSPQIKEAAKRIIIKPDMTTDSTTKFILKNSLEALQADGWIKTVLDDGTTILKKGSNVSSEKARKGLRKLIE